MAVRAFTEPRVSTALMYEVPGSSGADVERPFAPTVWLPLEGSDAEAKLAAWALYEGELRGPKHPRGAEVLRARMKVRGSECGSEYAEAFALYRAVMEV